MSAFYRKQKCDINARGWTSLAIHGGVASVHPYDVHSQVYIFDVERIMVSQKENGEN